MSWKKEIGKGRISDVQEETKKFKVWNFYRNWEKLKKRKRK